MQDKVFTTGEANAWFRRNREQLGSPEHIAKDWPLSLIDKSGIRPVNVCEVGCANGWRLAELQRRYSCTVWGFDPSADAIEDGYHTHGLNLTVGTLASPPFGYALHGPFDLVICSFVLHWIDRATLLPSLATLDRLMAGGGYLVIADFWPGDGFAKRRYHHRPDAEVWTFKADYAALFERTGMYQTQDYRTFNHDTGKAWVGFPQSDYGSAAFCALLRKESRYKCE